jgi:hypothetical protein
VSTDRHSVVTVLRAGLAAGAIAALPSGLPSTLHALLTGRDPLEATKAAGSILLPRERRAPVLLAAAVPVHVALSLGWGVVLARTLGRPTVPRGLAAGLAIAALDLGIAGRRIPPVRALPLLPQLADHAAYGAVAAAVLRRRRPV